MEDLAGEEVREQLKFENLVPEEEKTPEIIPILPGEFQSRKVEELIPNTDVLPDTYVIYPTGGYHPFYGVLNTSPRYQLPIWPCIKRIKFSEKFSSKEKLDNIRRRAVRNPNNSISQLNPYLSQGGYPHLTLCRISTYVEIKYARLNQNGKPGRTKTNKKHHVNLHKLVALAWIPNPNPEKFDITMHINDDTTNYLIENLKWGNARMNAKGTRKRPDTMEHKYLALVNRGIIKG